MFSRIALSLLMTGSIAETTISGHFICGAAHVFRFFGLSEEEKYEITSWAFSYFMTRSLTVTDAVVEAVRKVKPHKVREDGSPRLSKSVMRELELRVKNML